MGWALTHLIFGDMYDPDKIYFLIDIFQLIFSREMFVHTKHLGAQYIGENWLLHFAPLNLNLIVILHKRFFRKLQVRQLRNKLMTEINNKTMDLKQ